MPILQLLIKLKAYLLYISEDLQQFPSKQAFPSLKLQTAIFMFNSKPGDEIVSCPF